MSSRNNYDRKPECDEKDDLGDFSERKEEDDIWFICLSSDGDAKLLKPDETNESSEPFANLIVQQAVIKENFELKEKIIKYKKLCEEQVNNKC